MSQMKWAAVFTGVVCLALALWGALSYPLTGWNLLEIAVYEFVLLVVIYGVLRLVYNRAILDQN